MARFAVRLTELLMLHRATDPASLMAAAGSTGTSRPSYRNRVKIEGMQNCPCFVGQLQGQNPDNYHDNYTKYPHRTTASIINTPFIEDRIWEGRIILACQR
jgi:hypothetical protein